MKEHIGMVRRLVVAANQIDGTYYLCARKMGVNENTLSLIYALGDGMPHSQKQICQEWLIPKTTINTIVKELMAAGYVELLPSGHTREKTINLTESGKNYAEKIMSGVYEAEQQAIQKTIQEYSPQFVEAFEFFADQLCDEFEKQILNKN
ncbi:MAG: helix-turn-helix domain-containing protein [Angelakisella sp.]